MDKDKQERLEIFETAIGEIPLTSKGKKVIKLLNEIIEEEGLIKKMAKREKCDYPMSEFYIYKDRVLANERISTTEDCKNCDGFENDNCTVEGHCLITESPTTDK